MTQPDPPSVAEFLRRVDDLEAASATYLTLESLRVSGLAAAYLNQAIAESMLLVDRRRRLDPETGAMATITLCRLNRHHPLVREIMAAESA